MMWGVGCRGLAWCEAAWNRPRLQLAEVRATQEPPITPRLGPLMALALGPRMLRDAPRAREALTRSQRDRDRPRGVQRVRAALALAGGRRPPESIDHRDGELLYGDRVFRLFSCVAVAVV